MQEVVLDESYFYSRHADRERLLHVVDAVGATGDALAVLFRLEGFRAETWSDADALLDAIDRRRADLVVVVLDDAPDEGLALLRRIRAQRGAPPVFIVEDRAEVELAVLAMK